MDRSGIETHHSFDCPQCHQPFAVRLTHVVVSGQPEWSRLQQGQFNQVACPACGAGGVVGAPFILLHTDGQQATCFIPGWSELAEDQQQAAAHSLIQHLEQALAGQPLAIGGVRITESYQAMVGLAGGADSDEAPEDEQQAQIQQLLAIVQQLLNVEGAQRADLIRQLGEATPLVARFAGQIAEDMAQSGAGNPETIAALQELQRDLAAPSAPDADPAPPVTRRFDTAAASAVASPSLPFSSDSSLEAKPILRSGMEGRAAPSEPVVERPLNRPAVKLPHLVRVAVEQPAGGNSLHVRLLDPATGDLAEAPLVLPPPAALNRLRELMSKARLSRQNPDEAGELETLGRDLYAALLPDPLEPTFRDLWDTHRSIHVSLDLPAGLHYVPWEFFADEEGFLAQDPSVSLSRAVQLGRRRQGQPPQLDGLTLPLRLLIVVSSPLNLADTHRLDSDREVMLIRAGVKDLVDQGLIEIELEDEASLDQLRAAMDDFKPHIVHWSGHGFRVADPQNPAAPAQVGLLLEDEHGRQLELSGRSVAAIFKDRPQLRAVVLSACVSALPGSGEAIDSTAHELVKAGVPAVVAMQASIRDTSAIRFAEHFYPALVQGEPIAQALGRARARMAEAGDGAGVASDWAMPVLLTAHPDLHVFNFERQGAPRPRALFTGGALSAIGEEQYFVGRQKEQRRIRAALTRRTRGEKITILSGLGGFGKSTLAYRSLQRVATRFRCIHVIVCKKETWQSLDFAVRGLAEALAGAGFPELLGSLNADPTRQFTPEELSRLCASALNAAPAILVLDNVEDLLDRASSPIRPADPALAAWLEELLLHLDGGRVLITTRYDFSFTRNDSHSASIARVSLETLLLPEALRLMSSLPALGALSRQDQAVFYRSGLDTPQLIEWADAQRRQQGGVQRQTELLALHQRFSEKMVLDGLYRSLPEPAQLLLRRSAVYAEALPLEFLSRQMPGAGDHLAPLLDRKLLSRVDGQDVEEEPRFRQHESVRQFALRLLAAEEGEAGLQAAHLRAAEHYEYYSDQLSHELGDYLAAKSHFLAAGRLDQAGRLVGALMGGLQRAGLWQEALSLVRELRSYELSNPETYAALDPIEQINLLKQEADLMRLLGAVRETLPMYEHALQRARAEENTQAEGALLGNLGNAYLRLGEVPKAISYYEQALAMSRAIGDKQAEGSNLGSLGLAYAQLGDVRKAIGYHEQALVMSRAIGDKQGEGNVLGNLGASYVRLGEVPKAIGYHEQALAISRAIGDRQAEGNDLGSLGNAYFQIGEVQKAIGYYEQVLTMSRAIGDKQAEGNVLGNLGSAYFQLREVRKAIGYHEQALAIKRAIGDKQGEGNALGSLGNAYFQMGEVQKAIDYYEQVLTMGRAIGDKQAEGSSLGNLGAAYAQLGEVPKAIGYYEQALTISRVIGDKQLEGNVLSNLGNAYTQLSDVSTAIRFKILASVIKYTILDPTIRQVMGSLAQYRRDVGVAAFDGIVATVCQEEQIDPAHYQSLLAQYGVFDGPPLTNMQKRLIGLFGMATLRLEGAAEAAQQWLTTYRESADWVNLAAVLDLLLAGERDPAELLNPANSLDAIDTGIVEGVLAVIAEPGKLEKLAAELAQQQQPSDVPQMNDGLREAAAVLGHALAGNMEAKAAVEQQLLPQMAQAEGFANLARVVQRMLAGERDEAALLDPANGLDATDELFVKLALASGRPPQGGGE